MVASLVGKGLQILKTAGKSAKLMGTGGARTAATTFKATNGGVFAKGTAALRAGGARTAQVWGRLPADAQKAMLLTGGVAGTALT